MSWGEMTGAQALRRNTIVHVIAGIKTDRLTLSRHVRIMMLIDDAPHSETYPYSANYKNEFWKSNVIDSQNEFG
jgi:hypothetical protein